jgi:hypothetical protein
MGEPTTVPFSFCLARPMTHSRPAAARGQSGVV